MYPMEKYNNKNIEKESIDNVNYIPGILTAAYSSIIVIVNTNWFSQGLEKIIS